MRNFAIIAAVLVLGIVVGFQSPHIVAAAQTASAMGGSQPCGAMNHMMMQMTHSAADRAYMCTMMTMHGSMKHMVMTGDPDKDFLKMMIPHHQSAIDMAKAELQYGKNPMVRALANQIIAAQTREIQQMTAWLK